MVKDSTQFRQRFNRWKNGAKVYDAGKPIPEYDSGTGDKQQANNDMVYAPSLLPKSSKALGNLLYRTASFIPQTRVITNITDILGVSPDDEAIGTSDGADVLGTIGLLLNRKKKTPVNNGTLAKQYAEYYNKKLAKIIKPLNAVDVIGDAYLWVQDAKAFEVAMREEAPNGVWKSGIKIDPVLYGQ